MRDSMNIFYPFVSSHKILSRRLFALRFLAVILTILLASISQDFTTALPSRIVSVKGSRVLIPSTASFNKIAHIRSKLQQCKPSLYSLPNHADGIEDPDISSHPFIILPGFGNDAIDYINPLNKGYETSLCYSLTQLGIKTVEVVPIKRTDWLQIVWSVFSLEFWKNECKPTTLFSFYCRAVDDKVRDVNQRTGKPVVLIGHSAGGWLARGILGDGRWITSPEASSSPAATATLASDLVVGLVTLGSPHYAPMDKSPDMTRGAIKYVSDNYPGAFLSKQSAISNNRFSKIFYLTVAGTAVFGNSTAEKGSAAKFASESYLQVTGDLVSSGEESGDGIVPLRVAHLTGATQVTMDGVWHSIQAPENNWYGGDVRVVNVWLSAALKLLRATLDERNSLPSLGRDKSSIEVNSN